MFERPDCGERAVLVHLGFGNSVDADALEEFQTLAVSAGVQPVATVTGSRRAPDPGYFVGRGKLDAIRSCVQEQDGEVVLFNHALSPAQERNLERALKCRVLDRTGLILDIFAQRARSHEGKLQVELAQLRHLSTRLVRGWTHLERQKGGIGLRGPGETQLESDRRLIGDRIKQLDRRLEKVRRQREQGRRARRRAELPTVSLVGYTNAGKSTVFNALTAAGVYAADQLFATLDPTLRRLALPWGGHAVLADTVGFIRQLPHDLVAAFRSTLEETREADLLLHVVDASDDNRDANVEQVNLVLKAIGADAVPQIEVYNKLDRLDGLQPRIDRDAQGRPTRVWVSASEGWGLELLAEAVGEWLRGERVRSRVVLPPQAGRLRARLYALGAVQDEQVDAQGNYLIALDLAREELAVLEREEEFNSLISHEDPPLRLAAGGQAP